MSDDYQLRKDIDRFRLFLDEVEGALESKGIMDLDIKALLSNYYDQSEIDVLLGNIIYDLENERFYKLWCSNYNPLKGDKVTVSVQTTNYKGALVPNHSFDLIIDDNVVVNLVTDSNGSCSYQYTCNSAGEHKFSVGNNNVFIKVTHDTGWEILKLSNNVEAYSSSQTPQIRLKDGLVAIRGAVKKKTNITAANRYVVATLPVMYRPSYDVNIVQQGTSVNRFNLQIKSNGEMIVERYSANSNSAQVIPNEHWLNLNAMYMVD